MATNERVDAEEWSGGEPPEPPEWLESLLREGGFLMKCDAASREGIMLLKLRRADRKLASSWMSALAYLQALATSARVALDEVEKWAGFSPGLALDRRFGAAWCKLAEAIGWDDSTALVRLRLAFAEEAGDFLMPIAARKGQSGARRPGLTSAVGGWARDEVADVLSALDPVNGAWEPDVAARLQACEQEFRAARDDA